MIAKVNDRPFAKEISNLKGWLEVAEEAEIDSFIHCDGTPILLNILTVSGMCSRST